MQRAQFGHSGHKKAIRDRMVEERNLLLSKITGAAPQNRTAHTRIFSPVLYQLS
jgi:hypothetical protein